jgi:hypothetical protein
MSIKGPKSNTCIAIIKVKKGKNKGKLVFAADRRISWGFSQAQVMPESKLVKRNGLIMGATGASYLGQLIMDYVELPSIKELSPKDYMNTVFYKNVVELLKSKGFVNKDGNIKLPKDFAIELVVGYRGKLFSIVIGNDDDDDLHKQGIILIDEVNIPYATGCGGQLAWGSLLTTERTKIAEENRLILALNVAAEVSPGCDDNIDIVME